MRTKDKKNIELVGFAETFKMKPIKLFLATAAGGFGMWVVGGLWHNLLLPIINDQVMAHHDGLGIGLIAYLILAFLLTYLYLQSYKKRNTLFEGARIGIVVGILWVFPHGLMMAGIHDTSIIYEIKNTLYHMIEQGIGGIIVAGILQVEVHQSLKEDYSK